MNIFFKSEHCKTMAHCMMCRDKENKKWRESLMKVFDDIKKIDFECPNNLDWNIQIKPKLKSKPKYILKADGTVIKNGKPCKSCSKKINKMEER